MQLNKSRNGINDPTRSRHTYNSVLRNPVSKTIYFPMFVEVSNTLFSMRALFSFSEIWISNHATSRVSCHLID